MKNDNQKIRSADAYFPQQITRAHSNLVWCKQNYADIIDCEKLNMKP